jgi:hypothetical protein
MVHCHRLQHEDRGMMSQEKVVGPDGECVSDRVLNVVEVILLVFLIIVFGICPLVLLGIIRRRRRGLGNCPSWCCPERCCGRKCPQRCSKHCCLTPRCLRKCADPRQPICGCCDCFPCCARFCCMQHRRLRRCRKWCFRTETSGVTVQTQADGEDPAEGPAAGERPPQCQAPVEWPYDYGRCWHIWLITFKAESDSKGFGSPAESEKQLITIVITNSFRFHWE